MDAHDRTQSDAQTQTNSCGATWRLGINYTLRQTLNISHNYVIRKDM